MGVSVLEATVTRFTLFPTKSVECTRTRVTACRLGNNAKQTWTGDAQVLAFTTEEVPVESEDESDCPRPKVTVELEDLALGRGFTVRTAPTQYLRTLRGLITPQLATIAVNRMRSNHNDWKEMQKRLSADAQRILDCPNAGGNSEKSEAMSFELLHLCFGAKLVKTEMNIEYEWSISKRTDYSALVYGQRIGVSVTRGYKHRGEFDATDAQKLLQKKLNGVNLSTRDVIETDAWTKQMLHIWASTAEMAEVLVAEYHKLPEDLRGNTVVLITVVENAPWIFTNN